MSWKDSVSTAGTPQRRPSHMAENEILALIDSTPYAVLSTADAAGKPYGIPVTVCRVGRRFYFHGTAVPESRKAKNLAANPWGSLVWVGPNRIVEDAFTVEFLCAMASGPVSLVADRASIEEFLKAVRAQRAPSVSEEQFAQYLAKQKAWPKVWRLDAEEITGRRKTPGVF